MSDQAWIFFGVVVTNLVIVVGMFRRQGKQTVSINEVNRAVNHQAFSSPTLIERVIAVEATVDDFKEETVAHRDWEHRVFAALAHHVGFLLPHREPHVDPLIDPIHDAASDEELGLSYE